MSVRVFVEGNDEKNFIIKLLHHLRDHQQLHIEKNINFENYIEVMSGKSNLLDSKNSKYQKIADKIGYEIVQVLFVFDSDFAKDDQKCNGMQRSQECFKKLLEELNWNILMNDKQHLHIFDKNLDYFLVTTIKDKECYEHFDNLVGCLGVEKVKPNKKPIANLYRDLYPYPQFNFEDDNFLSLKEKLINLFKELNGK